MQKLKYTTSKGKMNGAKLFGRVTDTILFDNSLSVRTLRKFRAAVAIKVISAGKF